MNYATVTLVIRIYYINIWESNGGCITSYKIKKYLDGNIMVDALAKSAPTLEISKCIGNMRITLANCKRLISRELHVFYQKRNPLA